MYTFEKQTIGNTSAIKLINTQTQEYAQIALDFAGNLTQLVLLSPQNTLVSVIDGYQTETELVEHKGYKSAKLLPFPNRLADGKYTFNQQEYQLPINRPTENHAIHGLFYNQAFEISNLKSKPNSITLVLRYRYTGNIEGYPFPCVVKLSYKLSAKGLQCKTTVKNMGNTALPLGDGWHPYFKLGDTPLNQCLLQLPPCNQLTLDQRNLPTGNQMPNTQFATPTPIGNAHLDNAYLLQTNTKKAHTLLQHPTDNYQLCVWQQTGKKHYNYLQIYTPTHRQSIAIEPMNCAANAFNNRIGLITLQPNKSYGAKYGVQLKKTN